VLHALPAAQRRAPGHGAHLRAGLGGLAAALRLPARPLLPSAGRPALLRLPEHGALLLRELHRGPEFLCKECPKIHIHIDRIDKKDVPEEQEHMRRWLHERFEIKDKMLIEFYESPDPERRKRFPGKSVNSKLSIKKTLPSMLILSGLTAGMLMTDAGRKLYVNTWIYGTLLGCLWVTIKA
ncbi:AGPAT5 isoform 3, partial [Pongo abelii]